MAIHVFKNWLKRKIKMYPNAEEFMVPHNIVRHMTGCHCPKPEAGQSMMGFKVMLIHAVWGCSICRRRVY